MTGGGEGRRRARRAGRGAACAGRGVALLGCAPRRSSPPRLESANSAVLRAGLPGPRVSKLSLGEGVGWRAPRLPGHLLRSAGDSGDAGGSRFSPTPLLSEYKARHL